MDSLNWIYTSNPNRVLFGSGQLQKLPEELRRLNVSKPLILSTSTWTGVSRANELSAILRNAGIAPAGIFPEAKMHTPIPVTLNAVAYVSEVAADSVISIGGGSTVGLGKAISIRTGLYHIAVPTTYAGSEMTSSLGETENGRKAIRNEPKIRPGTVVYDVDLTLGMPPEISAVSGVNALAHAVEALYSTTGNPIATLLATHSIRSLKSLREVIQNPSSKPARTTVLYGAYLASMCSSSVRMALHHKLCHTLGGSFGLPHAETHTVMLPHSVSYNAPAVGAALDPVKELTEGASDPVTALNGLLKSLGVRRSLRELGMKEEDLDRAAEIACEQEYPNPRPLVKKAIREVLRRAWAGEDARSDL